MMTLKFRSAIDFDLPFFLLVKSCSLGITLFTLSYRSDSSSGLLRGETLWLRYDLDELGES